MEIQKGGIEVYYLLDNAYCGLDGEKRSPLDIDDCPVGCEVCSGDCYYYREDDEKFKPGGDGIDFKVIGSIFDDQEEGREMTENDAKEYLEDMLTEGQCMGDEIVARDGEEAIKFVISALEEIQQYRAIGTLEEVRRMEKYSRLAKKHGTVGRVIDECAEYEEIGTVEECQEARERQGARKPVLYQETNRADCPVCGNTVRGIDKPFGNWCSRCGQKLDWGILNGNG